MANYLDKNDPKFLFHEWVNQSDTVSDALNDFLFWVETEYQCTQEEEKIIGLAVQKFLLEDKKTKSAIAEYEQKLLSQWTKSVNGD